MRRMSALCFVACFALSGCEVPLLIAADANDAEGVGLTSVTFPAKLLLIEEDASEMLLAGSMQGHLNGAADFDLAGDDGVRCKGRIEPEGSIAMNCDGAQIRLASQGPTKKAFSGAQYRQTDDGQGMLISVFGWGKGANEAVLRHAHRLKRSLTAKEVRQLNPD